MRCAMGFRSLFLLLMTSGLMAQVGKPMPVSYQPQRRGEAFGSMAEVTWEQEGKPWKAEFTYPKGWEGMEAWWEKRKATPALQGRVTSPEGLAQTIDLDPDAVGRIAQEANAACSGSVAWREPHFTGEGSKAIYFGEGAEIGPWRLMRILWHVGGWSGPPPMPFVLVIQHRESGRWIAQGSAFNYPPVADRGDAMRVHLDAQGALAVEWWNMEERNVEALRAWRFTSREGRIERDWLPVRYALYTRTGAAATLADSPGEALHFGYQEVAWALDSWNRLGGLARAFADSPRRFVIKEDLEGAPMLPRLGSQSFQWAAEIYLVPWNGKPERLSLPKALARLKVGRWDVVLFRNGQGPAQARRLVEHRRDFPHSTPPVTPLN